MKIAQEAAEYIYNRQISDYPMYVDELESFIAFKINGGKTPKHIKIELDFVPVSEALPKETDVPMIYHVLLKGSDTFFCWAFVNGKWADGNPGTRDANSRVTHWAPISGLTNAEE